MKKPKATRRSDEPASVETAEAAPKPRRRRRTTQEIVDRILKAADREFELNGYAGATTAAIARRAGVAEALLFSNFGSKAKLFDASIFQPLNDHLVEFCATHMTAVSAGGAAHRDDQKEYIDQLQAFIERHARKFISLFFVHVYRDAGVNIAGSGGMQDYFDRAAALNTSRHDDRSSIDPRLVARISFAAIISCIVFRDWIFPKELADRDEIARAVTSFVLEGINARAL